MPLISDKQWSTQVPIKQRAFRASFNHVTYHSIAWRRSRLSNSYTVCFTCGNHESYGEIQHFFTTNQPNFLYAVIRIIDVEEDSIAKTVLPPDDEHLKKLFHSSLYGNIFKKITLTKKFEFIEVHSFVSRCIVVFDCFNNLFITKVDGMFEHN